MKQQELLNWAMIAIINERRELLAAGRLEEYEELGKKLKELGLMLYFAEKEDR